MALIDQNWNHKIRLTLDVTPPGWSSLPQTGERFDAATAAARKAARVHRVEASSDELLIVASVPSGDAGTLETWETERRRIAAEVARAFGVLVSLAPDVVVDDPTKAVAG